MSKNDGTEVLGVRGTSGLQLTLGLIPHRKRLGQVLVGEKRSKSPPTGLHPSFHGLTQRQVRGLLMDLVARGAPHQLARLTWAAASEGLPGGGDPIVSRSVPLPLPEVHPRLERVHDRGIEGGQGLDELHRQDGATITARGDQHLKLAADDAGELLKSG